MPDETHEATARLDDEAKKCWVECSCGAIWRIPWSDSSYKMQDEVSKTVAAHRSYFNRPTTRVD